MSKVTQLDARRYILSKKSFEGSNIHAEWKESFWTDGEDRIYAVYSYGWYPIFLYSELAGQWFCTDDGYSQTTKKQMSRIFPYGDVLVTTVPHLMMEALLCDGYNSVVADRLQGASYG